MNQHTDKSVYIRTFGCQMNVHDSAKLLLMLEKLGYKSVAEAEMADLILFNTCTIREKAHHKAISEIGKIRLIKKHKKDVIVGVCGCVAQQDKEVLFSKYDYLDFVFGPDQLAMLPKLLEKAIQGKKGLEVELIDKPEDYKFLNIIEDKSVRSTCFVSVMKGCNYACSYCIVPSVRGREVCRAPDEILSEVSQLAKLGAKEVVLIGQTVNSYKYKTASKQETFAGLIRKIADTTEIERIRFTSPHPKDVSDELIEEYRNNEKLCPHIHLPMQSGSTSVLKKMRRGYTRERYLEIINSLKSARPGMSFTTDIIVGFCGETNEEYEETISILQEIQFDSIFAFKYSPREGTYAYKNMKDDVENAVKSARLEKILSVQRTITEPRMHKLIGTTQRALAYESDRMQKGLITGRIPDNRIVHFSGNPDMIGSIYNVRITKAHKNSLAGEVVS